MILGQCNRWKAWCRIILDGYPFSSWNNCLRFHKQRCQSSYFNLGAGLGDANSRVLPMGLQVQVRSWLRQVDSLGRVRSLKCTFQQVRVVHKIFTALKIALSPWCTPSLLYSIWQWLECLVIVFVVTGSCLTKICGFFREKPQICLTSDEKKSHGPVWCIQCYLHFKDRILWTRINR